MAGGILLRHGGVRLGVIMAVRAGGHEGSGAVGATVVARLRGGWFNGLGAPAPPVAVVVPAALVTAALVRFQWLPGSPATTTAPARLRAGQARRRPPP